MIAALITQPSVREASKFCGLSETQIYARMKEPSFSELYRQTRRDLLSGCTANLQGHMIQAVSTMADIMNNQDNSPQVRLNAADTIFRHGLKLTEQIDIIERIENLEKMMEDDR